VADDFSMGELVRRLDRLEQLLLKVVSQDVYDTEQRAVERRFVEMERDLENERQARKEDVRELKAKIEGQGTNWRQAIYAGVIPSVLFLIGILLQLRAGTGK
jgi:hypothetical protein